MNGILGSAVNGLTAQGKRIAQASENIVNVSTTGSLNPNGKEPYVPKDVLFNQQNNQSLEAVIRPRDPAFIAAYQPEAPYADNDGFVAAPNVNLNAEQVTLIEAEHAYKAAASLIPVAKDMHEALIEALK